MEEDLNLEINEAVLKNAKRYAEQHGIDLSAVLEDFLARFAANSLQEDELSVVLSAGNCQEITNGTKWMVKEEQVSYQVTKTISQKELDAECITLEESKRRILKKIHDHFHRS